MSQRVQLLRDFNLQLLVTSRRRVVQLVSGMVLSLLIVAGLHWLFSKSSPKRLSFPTRMPGGAPLHWVLKEIVLHPILPRHKITTTDFLEALRFGVAAWNTALKGCQAPRLQLGAPVDNLRKVRQDATSMVVLREGFWCGDEDNKLEHCYDPTVEAITSIYPEHNPGQPENGAVREADIEINAVNYDWSPDSQRANARNLRALITHELGHVLGLDHACNTTEAVVNKQVQNPTAPVCDSANTSGAIMYPHVTQNPTYPTPVPGGSEAELLCAIYAIWGARTK